MADAVWLASVTHDAAWRTDTATESTGQDSKAPSGVPAGQHAKSEPLTRGSEEDRLPKRDADDRSANNPFYLLPAGLGEVPQPAATSLPDSADIVRALRLLKRKFPSWHEDEVIFDEDATAEQAAHGGLWLPVTKPDMKCWLDLTLVVDTSPSMVLWRSKITAFISLLERLGAFRTVRLRLLDAHRSGGDGSPATPVLRGGTLAAQTCSPAELLDPSGRRILLVLTDGVGQCWRQDLASPLLAQWGETMPVAVVHLLPQRLWGRTGLNLHRARLTVPGPLRPNRRWRLELPDTWLEPEPTALVSSGVMPVPVLELGARWLGWWARLVTGNHGDPADATVLLAGNQPRELSSAAGGRESDGSSPSDELSAHQQVLNFLSMASPEAFRLATLLAAVPVSLPVARLVQAELVPESGPDHLAEVLASGLVRLPSAAAGHAWDTITFDLLDTVREVLLSRARRAETAHVVRLVTEHFGDQISSLRHLRDALDAPDSTPDPELTVDTAHFVAIERAVMRALSGPYLFRADRLPSSRPEKTAVIFASASLPSAGIRDIDTLCGVTDRTDLTSEPTRSLTSPPDSPDNDTEPILFELVTPHQIDADDVPAIWGNVPPRNPIFTGRGELLDRLGERLTVDGTTAVLPVALHGMGGTGKTQVAVEYIYRHLHDYDIIWWIQASQQAQLRAGLTELAQRVGLPGSAEAHTAVPAVREALRVGRPFPRWLLVFDSAESPETVRPFFPASGSGQILVTSRNPDWAGIARPLEVAVFTREESKELLRRRGPEIDDVEADRLAEVLGDLPLAIAQAAAWRAETGMPVGEYLRLFDEKVVEILDTSAPADYEVSVAAAWNVSFDELRKRNPAAHQLLQVCAFFAPEPISRSLFEGIRGVTIAPELDWALRDPMQLSRTIRDINRYGLAKIDHRHNTLQLHRLVQLVLSNRMTPQRSAEMRHGAHLLLANLDPNNPVRSEQWPRYQDVLPHAYAAKVIECDDRWVRHLVVNLIRFLYYWGDHEEAASLARRAVDVWSEKLGEADLQTLQAARNLGFCLWTLGRYAEAAEINQRTLELHRQVSGENSEETLMAELAVATDLKGRGDFIAALDLNEQICQRAKGLFGDDDPTTLIAAHDLVVSLGLAGQYRRGRELCENTYRRRVDVLGYDNPNTIITLNCLVLARREAGDYVWSRIEQEKLAERSSKLFGADKAATLRRFHHLAVARRKDGDYQGALELSARVLERLHLRYGDNHPSAMACALAQAIDLRHASDFGPAHELGEQTFIRYRESLGEHHPHTLAALLDLAVTKRLSGDPAGARQLDERSLEQFRVKLGADHPYSIVSAINLASDLAALGETEAALTLDTEALDRANRVLGTDHPTTLAALTNLVLDLRTLGRTKEAETKYAEVLTLYRRRLGDTHPATKAAGSGIRADCDIDPLPL